MPRILTIQQLAVDIDQTRPIYDGNGLWHFIPKRRTRLTHFGLFWLDAVQLLFAPLCASPFQGKKDQRTWTPIKHITKRNHLRIKLKLFCRNRISPKMPFCFCYTEWLIEAIALDSKRSKQLCRVLLIPLRFGCTWVLAFILSCTGINAAQLSFEGGQLARKLLNKSFPNDNGTCNSIAINVYTYLRAFSFCVFCAREEINFFNPFSALFVSSSRVCREWGSMWVGSPDFCWELYICF